MNIIDVAIVLIIISFAIVGAKKGLIKTLTALVGIVLVFGISYIFKEYIGNFLCKYLPFFTFGGSLKGLVSLNILIYQVVGFFIIFSILMGLYAIIISISSVLQKIVNITIILKLPSMLGGFVIGLIEGYLLTFIILLIGMIPLGNMTFFKESKLTDSIINKTPIISEKTSDISKSITEIYTLSEEVANQKISINDANLKSIDIMLKYKVTTPHTIEQLIVLAKLKSVDGVEYILNKYK